MERVRNSDEGEVESNKRTTALRRHKCRVRESRR